MSIVVIAAPQALEAMAARGQYGRAQTFADTDADRALEEIARSQPGFVVVDQTFAATRLGLALIDRIKVDSDLSSCVIQIVALGGDEVQSPVQAATGSTDDVAALGATSHEASWEDMLPDRGGKRRARRFLPVNKVDLLIGGDKANLINFSTVGVQVVSPTILRPTQRIRMVFGANGQESRLGADVVWARLELPEKEPLYRAGLDFLDTDADTVEALYARCGIVPVSDTHGSRVPN